MSDPLPIVEPDELTSAESPAEEERWSIPLGIFGKTPPFTKRQRRVFLIATTAGFFDQYDRALLTLALKQIQKGLQISENALGNMLTLIRLGYLGSLVITPLADVFGRRRLLLYTVVAYTAFTGLAAISPNANFFVACEMLARIFAGAEGTIALVILSEEVDAGVRGWAIGLLSALASVGFGIAALAFAGINIVPYGWRGLYALALIPLVLIIPLRQALPESKRFEREQLERTSPRNILVPLRALFGAYPGRLIMLLSVAFLGNLGGNPQGFFFSKYLQEAHGWSPGNVSSLYFMGGALGIMGNIVAGRLSDRFGRRRMGALFYMLAPVLAWFLYSSYSSTMIPIPILNRSISAVIPIWVFHLFFDVASSTIVTAYSAELFPTSYRSTAGSVLAVAGTTGGALGFFLEGVLYRSTGSHWSAIRYLLIAWLAPGIIMLMFFPETAGLELETISPDEAAQATP
ncbi:MAG TPA: MFS transporter [Candidatus Binataceae bacterium]|nr:MFS transporter [Candidatus Binataceae bacterium]